MSSETIKNSELGNDGLENINPELTSETILPDFGGNDFNARAKINTKIKRTIQTYSSHEDMENHQLTFWASLKPSETMRQLKLLIMTSYDIKSGPQFSELTKSINFERDRS
ncbi:hypothetical protein [Lunatibacter salilacus]|uniref:hypothetical protein n=1 Tax=Lunatibacter salilacus TaxID=2483804 RepID=UPI00131E3A5F|nr:hypothetical protein [Lunatibacter salilacus]